MPAVGKRSQPCRQSRVLRRGDYEERIAQLRVIKCSRIVNSLDDRAGFVQRVRFLIRFRVVANDNAPAPLEIETDGKRHDH